MKTLVQISLINTLFNGLKSNPFFVPWVNLNKLSIKLEYYL